VPDPAKPLKPAAPPEGVHELSLGDLSGGGMSYADMVAAMSAEPNNPPARPSIAAAIEPPRPAAATPTPPPAANAPLTPDRVRAAIAATTPVPARAADTPSPGAANTPSRFEELLRKPSVTVPAEDIQVLSELSDILASVNGALAAVKKLKAKYPYLIAPNITGMWEDNLQETATVMMREFHNLRNGRAQKSYQKKNICTMCSSVFLEPLPDGICDECKGKTSGPMKEYG
jgi:hypothetical protein